MLRRTRSALSCEGTVKNGIAKERKARRREEKDKGRITADHRLIFSASASRFSLLNRKRDFKRSVTYRFRLVDTHSSTFARNPVENITFSEPVRYSASTQDTLQKKFSEGNHEEHRLINRKVVVAEYDMRPICCENGYR